MKKTNSIKTNDKKTEAMYEEEVGQIKKWVELNINRLTAFGVLITLATFLLEKEDPTKISITLGYILMLLSVVVWLTMEKKSISSIVLIKNEKEQLKYLAFYITILFSNGMIVLYAISTIQVRHASLLLYVYMLVASIFIIKSVDCLNKKRSRLLLILYIPVIVFSLGFMFIDFYYGYRYSTYILEKLH